MSPEESIFSILATPGSGTVQRFLEAWYGAAPREPQPLPEGASPLAVRELAAMIARWPRAFGQNHLEVDGALLDGRFRRFMRENQSVVEWAVDETGPDGVVRFREVPDGLWLAEAATLGHFPVQAVVFEAISDAGWGDRGRWERPAGYLASRFVPEPGTRFIAAASAVSAGDVIRETLLTGLEPLPWDPWLWPAEPTVFFAGQDAIAWSCLHDSDSDTFVAARQAKALDHLRGRKGIDLLLREDPETDLESAEAEFRRVQTRVWRRSGPLRRHPQDEFSKSMRRSLPPPE
jgi:hypothetical protein